MSAEPTSISNIAREARPFEPIALPSVVAGVSLWWSDLAPTQDDIARISPWLATGETERAARFATAALREKYIAGRATLRWLLARVLGISPDAVPLRRGLHGRPELDGTTPAPDFNVSHTDGGAVIAIGNGLPPPMRVGVDVEREDRRVGADRLARKFLTPREQATLTDIDAAGRRQRFLRYWTCKEAMSKATGDGLSAPFAQLDVDIDESLRLIAGPAPYDPPAWTLRAIAVPTQFLATLALWDSSHA